MDNSMNSTSTLYGYPIPEGVPVLKDFRVRVRIPNQEWVELGTYRAKIDMHDVREASVAYFDFCGQVECEVTALRESVRSVEIRPRSSSVDFTREGDVIRFFLDRPAMLSVEINGDRFHNLHLFAENPLKAEYFLPTVVSALTGEGRARVRVLRSEDKWYGITYREDKPAVVAAIAEKTASGLYPDRLWEAE